MGLFAGEGCQFRYIYGKKNHIQKFSKMETKGNKWNGAPLQVIKKLTC